MSTYCVTFRIADKTINGKTYDQRRQQLIDNVHAEGAGYWEETTSFFLKTSSMDTNEFSANACKGLSSQDDMVFIFDPADMSACYSGPVKYLDVLKSFFPKAKKLP